MCGICGIVSEKKLSEQDISIVHTMSVKLTHRGPDGEGSYNDDTVKMMMRRLSIIDLVGGSQPLYNEDRTIVLIANGEIYNFVELRKDLEQKGHVFSTKSDCETIIHSYEEYGNDFITHLRGMFAFSLYDVKNKKLLLVRDRLGEKPLYLYREDGKVIFSSELKSILEAVPKDKRILNKNSLYTYFFYGYVPDPQSIFENIEQIPAGSCMEIAVDSGVTTMHTYWRTDDLQENIPDPVHAVRNQIENIEKIIIRSDVPLGISLSGGIDSSLIATLASKYTSKPLHAFSIGYPGYPENDERKMAHVLSDKLGCIFHDIEISEHDFGRDFEEMVSAMDDPIADIAAYGYYSVSKEARKQNIPVLLAGFGGDELFWGYEWTRTAVAYNKLKQSFFGKVTLFFLLLVKEWRFFVRNPWRMFVRTTRNAFSKYLIMYELNPLFTYLERNKNTLFTKNFLSLVDEKNPFHIEQQELTQNPGLQETELLTKIWLLSNCIDLGDRMSMTHSIELRLPLVDYKLYEDVISIRKQNPDDYTLGYKHWLIKATKDLLPAEIYTRKKRGFTPPTTIWIKKIISKYNTLLTDGYLVKSDIIEEKFMKKSLMHIDRNIKFLYTAVLFEVWAKKYLI